MRVSIIIPLCNKDGGVIDYPKFKLFVNRLANLFVKILFRHGLNDTTNAFKGYLREVIEGIRPILSPHFNITVELPLKAIVRGYSYTTMPITWRNRRTGVAKLKSRKWGAGISLSASTSGLKSIFHAGTTARRFKQ
jgi:dolichol-phosphate mannosyltransferase